MLLFTKSSIFIHTPPSHQSIPHCCPNQSNSNLAPSSSYLFSFFFLKPKFSQEMRKEYILGGSLIAWLCMNNRANLPFSQTAPFAWKWNHDWQPRNSKRENPGSSCFHGHSFGLGPFHMTDLFATSI